MDAAVLSSDECVQDKRRVEKQDVIVIGAGLNGLIAAAYLAKSGRRVTVIAGGGKGLLDSSDPIPGKDGALHPKHGEAVSLPQDIVWDLGLEAMGLRFEAERPALTLSKTGAILRDADPIEMDRRLRAFSPRDADAYRNYRSLIVRQHRLLSEYIEKGRGSHPPRRAFLNILKDAGQDGMTRSGQTLYLLHGRIPKRMVRKYGAATGDARGCIRRVLQWYGIGAVLSDQRLRFATRCQEPRR